MNLKDSILAAKPAEELCTVEAIKDSRGKPIKVLVRGLSVSDQMTLESEGKDDNMRRGLMLIVQCVLDPKTKERVFTAEDVEALEGLPGSSVQALLELVTRVNKAPETEAKNS